MQRLLQVILISIFEIYLNSLLANIEYASEANCIGWLWLIFLLKPFKSEHFLSLR